MSTDGIARLGGDDFDKAIQKLVREKYQEETGDELEDYEYTLIQAEQDKIALSTRRKCLAGGDGEVGDGSTPVNITGQNSKQKYQHF